MSWLFGGKKKTGKTVLMLDVENSSVAAGLIHLSQDKPPRLFAETRIHTPLLRTRDALDLARAIEKATEEALQHSSLVAARLRNSERFSSLGNVAQIQVFLHAPWSTLVTRPKQWSWQHEPLMMESLGHAASAVFDAPTSFHPFADAALHTTNTLFEPKESFLLCVVTGEVAELLLVQQGAFVGRATIPFGSNLGLRTLQSHGTISKAEAHSLLALARHEVPTRYTQALSAAAVHFTRAFAEAVKELCGEQRVQSVLVVGAEPGATWIARSLSEQAPYAENVFTQGAAVRALHTRYLAPHVTAHAPNPDLALLVESLFVGDCK